MKPRPPAWARSLVRHLVSREDRAFVLADLEERFQQIVDERGPRAARRWYRSQALRGVPSGLRGLGWSARRGGMDGTWGDLRYGVRVLARRPLYTFGVAGTLALGLASAAAVLVVTWRVWLAPLPFPDPDRIVRLFEVRPQELEGASGGQITGDGRRWRLSPPLVEDLRAHEWQTLSHVSAVSRNNFDWRGDDGVSPVSALQVSPDLFSILGIAPRLGRTLGEDESVAEVVLTADFWERAFGGDPGVVGSGEMILDGVSRPIVGVVDLPGVYPPSADIVIANAFDEDDLREGMRGARYLDVVARVRPGRTASDAASEMDAFVKTLGETYAIHEGWGGDAETLAADLMRPYRGVLSLLLAAGLAFLALAVVNVAGLVASRRVEGLQERSVRLALGASTGRLLRHSLAESAVVGALGAVVGLIGAYWFLSPIRRLLPADLPRSQDVGLDLAWSAMILGSGLTIGLFVGLLGHLTGGRDPDAGSLTTAGRGGSAPGLGGRRFLVVGQVALTTLLVTGGTVTLREVVNLRAVETGFAPEGVRFAPLLLNQNEYGTDASRLTFWRQVLDGLEARGVEAAVAVNPPMAGARMTWGFQVDDGADEVYGEYHTVSRGYFSVMGVELVEGRLFDEDDHEASAPVVIISEDLAREHFPEGGAVGRDIRIVASTRTIVGVVQSTRHFGPDQEAPPELYVPLGQDPWTLGHVLMRTDRADLGEALVDLVEGIDPTVTVPAVESYLTYLTDWYAPLRLRLVIVGTLAVVGMSLAGLGIYALVAYHVSSRRRELGIRMALGAPGEKLFAGVVLQGATLAAAGLLLGMGAWYVALPTIRDRIDTIAGTGVAVPLLVAALVGGLTVLATVVPARRSMSVDPVVTLKAE